MQAELLTTTHNQAIELRVRDLLLNALTVSSGAVDAISFLALGKVFSAFMTGNIAFLGLRVAGAPAPGAVAIVASVAAFAAGVLLFSWPSGLPVTASLQLTSPMCSSARGRSRWGCRAPPFERFTWMVCLRPLRPPPSYSLWATSPTGPRPVRRGGDLQACSSLCSSAQLPGVFSWFTRPSMRPSCHS